MDSTRQDIARARKEFFDGQGNVLEAWRDAEAELRQNAKGRKLVFLREGLEVSAEMAEVWMLRWVVEVGETIVVPTGFELLRGGELRVIGAVKVEDGGRVVLHG